MRHIPRGTGLNLTRDQLKILGRRQEQPKREPGDLLALWVNGPLVNTKNRRWHWKSEMTYKKRWREAVAQVLFEVGFRPTGVKPPPLAIAFHAHTVRAMDSQDGLRVALAPVVDALGQYGVLTGKRERAGLGDADIDGHDFIYTQAVDRARRGVQIHVRLRERTS